MEASALQQQPNSLSASSLSARVDNLRGWAQSLGRAGFYTAATAAMARVIMPKSELGGMVGSIVAGDSFAMHRRVLSRPGMRQILQKVEREDLALLPFFLASIPADIRRLLAKRVTDYQPLPVKPSDDFPYPDYYLNDFHNQVNGNLSMRAALTYEWQIRFLFLGTNRLMRQSVIDELPEGDDLDILDVGCGTGSWISQARLQNRKHKVTGIDLSPQYLRVARLFRGKEATFLQHNAEELPQEWTGRFDRVVHIWMFHELPPAAIERATAEIARVLKPSGKLLFLESIQSEDAPEDKYMEEGKQRFQKLFNEPHFGDYQKLNLRQHFARFGLRVDSSERWYASKLLTLSKVA